MSGREIISQGKDVAQKEYPLASEEEAKRLATEHWDWVVRWLEIVYKDAFIHGYKHGYDKAKKETDNDNDK